MAATVRRHGGRVAAVQVPSRRPPEGLSAHARGASLARSGHVIIKGCPPRRELIGLRQVDGMAQREPCQESEQTPGANGSRATVTSHRAHRKRRVSLAHSQDHKAIKP